jgi:cytoskeleton protein RodZ
MATSEDDDVGRENSNSRLGLGAKLKTAREAQDLTIEEIAAELRIGVPSLNALERGEYETLGPPVFAKGYLKQYGARLGLNAAELVADYEREAGNQNIDIAPSRTIRLRDERQITVWIVAALVIAAIAAVIWFWWWLGTDRGELPAAITISDEATVVPDEAVTQVRTPTPSQTPTRTPTQARRAETAPIANQAEAAESGDDREPAIIVADDPDPALEVSTEPAAAAEPYLGPELEIVFVADSWTEITAESGERLFYNLGRAGSSTTVPADRDMNLFFGNAAGVELRLDGEPYAIPATARRRGNTAQWDLAARVDEPGTDPAIDE